MTTAARSRRELRILLLARCELHRPAAHERPTELGLQRRLPHLPHGESRGGLAQQFGLPGLKWWQRKALQGAGE